jgi:hypothetical protein
MTQPAQIQHNSDVIARALVDLRDRVIQKSRIAFNNRLSAMENTDDATHADLIETWYDRFAALERDLDRDIARLADDMPIVDRMIAVKGVGKTLAVKVVAMIDITRADTVSALWKFAGYGVSDGHRDQLKKGQTAPYNTRLKTTCYLVGSSFLKTGSPYRRIYDDARAYYAANRPEWTDGHQHAAAMRKMIKIWLSHLWAIWREMEGLPVTEPYITDGTKHRYIAPEEFGW